MRVTFDWILNRERTVDPADKINYDNTSSALTSANVQDAIDEITTNITNNELLITYYEVVSGASSGNQVTVPTSGVIQLDKFGASKDAILSKIDGNNNVVWESPKDSLGNVVTTSMDVNGNYTFSSTPVDANVAIIYAFKISVFKLSNADIAYILYESELTTGADVTMKAITNADSPYAAAWGEDISVDCTLGDVQVNLPTAVSNSGKDIWLTKTDNSLNKITFSPNGGESVLTNLDLEITEQYTSKHFRSTGSALALR